jgi:Icc-related predicted phosphoesterase
MKIALASDLHGNWFGLDFEPADLLIIAGDILGQYVTDKKWNATEQLDELEQLNWYLGKFDYKKIILIAGNHDFAFQYYPDKCRKTLTNATYLADEATTFQDIKIYGSPWQPYGGGWAFNFPNPKSNLRESIDNPKQIWKQIPEDTEILITHTPPLYCMDKTYDGREIGCQYLAEELSRLKKLKMHVFGHIHASRGHKQTGKHLSVNAANSKNHSEIAYPMTIIEYSDQDYVVC